jgi:CubicO group peptidase (beta-lactamase class C family)
MALRILRIAFSSILLAHAATSAAAQARARPDELAGFDAQVARAVSDWQAPGFAIAVVKDGAVVFAKGYGVRDVGSADAVDTHTLFAIGSTTKAMTAAALGMLVDEKKLKWDDPVSKHLPWFELKDPLVTRELTVRDLLTHRAGLPNADFLWYGQAGSRRAILEKAALIEPAYSFRSSFIYQNVMYAAAGAVLEAASGMPFERFFEERIFRPLGMADSLPAMTGLASRANRAEPHFLLDGRAARISNVSVDGVGPAGSVWSSVDDMSKWMRLLLGNGRMDGRQVLSPEVVAELFRPQTMVPREAFYPTASLTRPDWTTYGLGWFQQDYGQVKVDFHTGSIDGMVAICGLIRSEGIGVFILSNLDHAELRHALMLTVFDRLLGRPARDWSGEMRALYASLERQQVEAQARDEAQRTLGTIPSGPLAAYSGQYSDPLHGEVLVTLEPSLGALRLRYGSAFEGRLEHWSFDTFRARWDATWRGTSLASFVRDANGRVNELRLMGAAFSKSEAPR